MNKCRKNGYVETLLGRRRYLPEITSNILQAQSHAERQALNTTIQGSAADVVKQAMILIDKRLANLFLSSAVQKKNILKEHGDVFLFFSLCVMH